jgi:23S rRNA (guanosine2251-2'-O)-methyltransferase
MRRLTNEEITNQRLDEPTAASPEGRFPLIVILENIRSLYNVGSIFRTADAVRATAVYTVGYTPHPPRPEIDKTALGATRTVPHRHFSTSHEAIDYARDLGFSVSALEITTSSRQIFDLRSADFPLAIILGGEVSGVSDEALSQCDFALEIPMIGAKHSLNVAVAFGVAAFEALRVGNPLFREIR